MLGKFDRYMKKMKLDHFLKPYKKINLKWINNLNVRFETIKILEGNMGSKISDICHSNIFADISPCVRETNRKINK